MKNQKNKPLGLIIAQYFLIVMVLVGLIAFLSTTISAQTPPVQTQQGIFYSIWSAVSNAWNWLFVGNDGTTFVTSTASATGIIYQGKPLLDNSTINLTTNKVFASRYGMEITSDYMINTPSKSKDYLVNFTWRGISPQNISWVIVYEDGAGFTNGYLGLLTPTNVSYQDTEIRNAWATNYLVDKVTNTTALNLSLVNCEIGNKNNTFAYLVNRTNGNSTISQTIYCFTNFTAINSTAYYLAGNYDAQIEITKWRIQNVESDITSVVKYKGKGLLNDSRLYYDIFNSSFLPNQTYLTRWKFNPVTKTGKWHIFGYDSARTIQEAISLDEYIYLDPWWNNSWSYKQSINITDIGGIGVPENYSVWINVTFATGKMNSDFSDLRFANSSETSELNYYIESNTSNSAQVWVKIPQISSDNSTLIYMYYGNPTATTGSNRNNTFLFFDDFYSVNPTNWNNYTLGNCVIGGTPHVITCPKPGGTTWNYILDTTARTNANFSISVRFNTSHVNANPIHWWSADGTGFSSYIQSSSSGWTGDTPIPPPDELTFGGTAPTVNLFYTISFSVGSYVNATPASREISFIGATNKTIRPSELTRALVRGQVNFSSSILPTGKVWGLSSNNAGQTSIDWVQIRKYLVVEPSYLFGAEQSNSAGNLSVTLISPTTNQQYNPIAFTINATPLAGQGVINYTLYVWNATDGTLRFTNTSTTSANTTTIYNYINQTGQYKWNALVWGGQSQNESQWASTNATFNFTYYNPNVVWNSQNPTNLTSTNTIVSGINITYNITNGSDPQLLLSSIYIAYKTNSTLRNEVTFINGTGITWGYDDYTSNISKTFLFHLEDNEFLPASYNLDDDVTDDEPHTRQTLTSNNAWISMKFFNMTNNTQYNFFEIMSNSSASQQIWYCNSSYNFGADAVPSIVTSPRCTQVGTIPANSPYNHIHSPNSKHQLLTIVINTTTGSIGTVKVTETGYFMLRGVGGGVNTINYFTVPNITRTDQMKLTTNNGVDYTNQSFTVDSHIHQFDLNTSLYYYVCANDTDMNQNCSSILVSPFGAGGFIPPSSPNVYSPIEQVYRGNISINWTASQVSVIGEYITQYNISLLYPNFTRYQTINSNVSTNLSYLWDSNLAPDGEWVIRVTATDNNGLNALGNSINFTINNIAPTINFTFPTPTNGSVIGTLSPFINYTVTNSSIDSYKVFDMGNTLICNAQPSNCSLSSDGEYYVFANVKNSYGYDVNTSDTRYFFVDTSIPITTITGNGTLFNSTTVNLSVSATDTFLDSCWYSNKTGGNTTYGCGNTSLIYFANEGNNNVYYYANDSFGRVGSSNFSFVVDTIPPEIYFDSTSTINNSYLSASNRFFVNVTVNETYQNLSQIMIPRGSGGWFIWDRPNISFVDYFNGTYADSLTILKIGNIGNSYDGIDTFAWIIDPNFVNLTYGEDYYFSNGNLPITGNAISGEIINSFPNKYSLYILSNSSTTFQGYLDYYKQSFSNTYSYYNFTSCSLSGICNSTETRKVTFDSIIPIVNITGNSFYNSTTVNLSISASDINLQSCWYSNKTGGNQTIGCGNNSISYLANEGNNNVYWYANDTVGNVGYANFSFLVDTLAPNVTLISPINNSYLNYSNVNFTSSITSNFTTLVSSVNYPNSALNSGSGGQWNNPDNIKVSDGDSANCTDWGTGFSRRLDASQFNFSMPVGSKINGILVEIRRKEDAGSNNIFDDAVNIIKATNASGSQDKSKVPEWGTTYSTEKYGSLTDTWGEVWNYTDINSNNFGVSLKASGVGGTASVDFIRITINYSSPNGIYLANATITITNQSGSLVNQTTTTFAPNVWEYVWGIPIYLIDGVYNWWVGVFDQANNQATSENNTVTVDTAIPIVNITGNAYYNTSTVNLTISANDANLLQCWYSNKTGGNKTIGCGNNSIIYLANENAINNVYYYANDTVGNVGYANFSFVVDTIAPKVKLTIINGTKFKSSPVQMQLRVDITEAWTNSSGEGGVCFLNNNRFSFCHDGSSTNPSYTIPGPYNQGVNNLQFNMTDLSGNHNSSIAYQFYYDSILPNVEILYPSGIIPSILAGENLTLNFSVSDTNLESCWFSYNNVNTTISCNANSSFIYVYNQNSITLYANDTFGNINSTTKIFASGIIVNIANVNYSTSTYETKNENFIINFTTSAQIFPTVELFYNSTKYDALISCSNNNCLGIVNLDIPLLTNSIEQNRSFYFVITAYNGTGFITINSSIYYQLVQNISLTNYNTGTVAINFTSWDEQNKTRLSPYSFDGTFYYYMGLGTTYKELNITNNTASEILLYINPNNTYFIEAIIAYSAPNSSTSYFIRNWFYQNYLINNIIKNVPLYLLKSSSSTSFILQVQDNNILPVKGVLIEAQRCYPGTNQIETVFKSRTDANGLTTGNLEAETALYQFLITNDSNTLLAVTPCSKVVPQTAPYTLLFQLGAGYQSPFININNITNIVSITYFNTTSNTFTWTYSDTSSNFNYSYFTIKALNHSGTAQQTICSGTNLLSSGILSCNISQGGTYVADVYVIRNGQKLIDQVVFSVNTLGQSPYAVFLGFLIIIVCAFAFKFNEIAGIWLTIIGVVFCQLVGLINFGPVFITSIICLGVLITAILER